MMVVWLLGKGVKKESRKSWNLQIPHKLDVSIPSFLAAAFIFIDLSKPCEMLVYKTTGFILNNHSKSQIITIYSWLEDASLLL